ncbi:class I SAM-dependent methyltransferase [Bailinhaonella thermotolerans]|uniref:Class I SAM-dependent methyltransferase n=2 Tax=Bailinhaonella thermotolerans TaxID=1070861 RepID=A0A3A4ASA2_9ACTN|nr:class I SAM-dependent methyltransferase [Bailinhaonella thermotolerans]
MGYGQAADDLAKQYESVSFRQVHAETLHLYPAPPARVLDVGAGTGRDAAALAALGHEVVAVEPTPELRAHGTRLHGDLPVEWLDDHLPDLAEVRRRGGRYDLILLTAVWMHLDATERGRAMVTLADLLAPGGVLAMVVRRGPVPPGRRMFDVPVEETAALAAGRRLRLIHLADRPDLHGREGVHMTTLAFTPVPR